MIVVGLLIAKAQLESWKIEAVQIRRRDTAEDLLGALGGFQKTLARFFADKSVADLIISLSMFGADPDPERERMLIEVKVTELKNRIPSVDSVIDDLDSKLVRFSIYNEGDCAVAAVDDLTGAWDEIKGKVSFLQLMLLSERVGKETLIDPEEMRHKNYQDEWSAIPSGLNVEGNEISTKLGSALSTLRECGLKAIRID
ncbi:hypothetical protein [Paracoccus sp. S-4012]|uniref:hypothetical protein n=1 Tax=Paracoccus sp. S-4012 TaxID=2665648 RepID=UPI0018A1C45F|nr:hypothetical protein [Paracoccus sp. S-4012]